MNTVEQTIMPFCENWYRYLKRKSDAEMLAFFKTYLKMCFEDYEPTEDDGEAYDYYWIMKPIVETRIRKIAYGKAGGRPKKDIEKDTEKVEKDTEKDKTPSLEKKRNEVNRKEGNKMKTSSSSSATTETTNESSTSDFLATSSARHAHPTLEEVRQAARSLQIPIDFAEYFCSEMDKLDWEVIDYYSGGQKTVRVNRQTYKHYLTHWWKKEKKSRAAREENALREKAQTGAGRCDLPSFTGDITDVIDQ